ncbi:MAG: PilW family protein [Burkholderiales bacterium]
MSDHTVLARRMRRGFTIVEFLIAVAIGLIVSLVIGQIFIGSRESFSSQEDLARVQEAMRNASTMLARSVRVAGFRNHPGVDPNEVFTTVTGLAVEGVDNISASGFVTGSDTITVRFQGMGVPAGAADGTIVDCIGQNIPFGTISSNRFAIRTSGTTSGLFCSTDNGTTWNELISDVQNMQIMYGVDNDNDGTANHYVRVNDVTDVNQIVSVRVWMLMRSPNPTANAVDSTTTHTMAGNVYGPFSDRFVRRVFYTTINLRNRVP